VIGEEEGPLVAASGAVIGEEEGPLAATPGDLGPGDLGPEGEGLPEDSAPCESELRLLPIGLTSKRASLPLLLTLLPPLRDGSCENCDCCCCCRCACDCCVYAVLSVCCTRGSKLCSRASCMPPTPTWCVCVCVCVF